MRRAGESGATRITIPTSERSGSSRKKSRPASLANGGTGEERGSHLLARETAVHIDLANQSLQLVIADGLGARVQNFERGRARHRSGVVSGRPLSPISNVSTDGLLF